MLDLDVTPEEGMIFHCAGRLPVNREFSTFGICRARSTGFYVTPLA